MLIAGEFLASKAVIPDPMMKLILFFFFLLVNSDARVEEKEPDLAALSLGSWRASRIRMPLSWGFRRNPPDYSDYGCARRCDSRATWLILPLAYACLKD